MQIAKNNLRKKSIFNLDNFHMQTIQSNKVSKV